jgi:hypothetical protein
MSKPSEPGMIRARIVIPLHFGHAGRQSVLMTLVPYMRTGAQYFQSRWTPFREVMKAVFHAAAPLAQQ